MELSLTDDQTLFVETTRRFLADTSPITATRQLGDTPLGFTREWWQRGAELGWTSLLAPESVGGTASDPHAVNDLANVAFQRGRCVAPGPFAALNTAVAAMAGAAAPAPESTTMLEATMAGEHVIALAAQERAAGWPVAASSRLQTVLATVADGSLVVSGTKTLVEAAGAADSFLVLAAGVSGPVLVAVPAGAAGVEIVDRESIDLVRRFADVEFRDVNVAASSIVGTILQLAETVGVLDRVHEFTKEWAFDRHTFGRPLASYQEIKHRFADMTLWLEASKATVVAAARALGAKRSDAAELVSTAASYVDDHGPELVQDCVQMHGGIGVTWEHDIHLFLRRATINALTFGTTRDHRERLAAMTLSAATD